MIEAIELRIGNYVDVKNSSHIVFGTEPGITKVDSVGYDGINLDEEYGVICAQYKLDNIFGVPITTEILEKCGFEIEKTLGNNALNTNAYKVNFHIMRHGSPNTWVWGSIESIVISKRNPHIHTLIKYLHQLQNLYYALTGEELTVNL